ncbi:adenylyl-sulfate kinase [Psychroflexus montanilacus]|uniref:adenylyl-sulfate kinase n=1 Tax=Psychroflexus montanilacus TaxID=2873598 RepID=UPI001CCC2208|nr:adenylyl-sulfate kinase [Psychroflexus montanilacus]MBZ9652222.1 adenylyl-sulfate kinase [Psychroflexus montanilacus]
MSENIVIHDYDISRSKRNKVNGHESFVLWFTGLSGSGKSTIANKVEEELFYKGISTYALDGDNIRSGINKGLGFTKEDRLENLRRIAEVGKLFVDAGIVTIAAFVSPLISDRDQVKQIVGENDLIEIFVDTSLEECEKRDVKGLYKKARAGEIKNFTGIDAPYEAPEKPEIHIQTETTEVDQAVQLIINYLEESHRI